MKKSDLIEWEKEVKRQNEILVYVREASELAKKSIEEARQKGEEALKLQNEVRARSRDTFELILNEAKAAINQYNYKHCLKVVRS